MAIADHSHRKVAELIDLSGRAALVTGGGRGVGLAVAARLAETGADVAIADLDGDRAEQAAACLAGRKGRVAAIEMDVASTTSVNEGMAVAAERFGGLGILVNSAALFPSTPHLADMNDEAWQSIIDVNAGGIMRCSRAAIPYLARAPYGAVICNITSRAAYRVTTVGMGAYAASKHAADGLTKVMALELGPRGIRVVAVAPIYIDTPGLADLRAAREQGETALDPIDALNASLPLQRVAVADDVARIVLMLVSDMAALVTGSVVLVDAGAMVR